MNFIEEFLKNYLATYIKKYNVWYAKYISFT